ncbi:MAG: hypothetical protein RLY97_1324 [Pseudomonadota bacterium]|jgi:pimeloyl-ACP methyl ester carboxylesterase
MPDIQNVVDELRSLMLGQGARLWKEAEKQREAAWQAFARRADLARMPKPLGVSGPSAKLFLSEIAAIGPRPLPDITPALHPMPVMLLPGFGAHPLRMRPLMKALTAAGHSPHEWGLGFNFGPTPENFAFLIDRVQTLARDEGAKIALVGWSLGGLFARELAKNTAENVACVITMGSPFSGDMRANNAWRAYEMVTGYAADNSPIPGDFAQKPPVPTVAIWSPKDGIVSPRSAAGWPTERDRAVSVRVNHLGFAHDPLAVAEVLRQLDLV